MKKSLAFGPVFSKLILIVVMSVLLLISTMTTVSAQSDTQESQQIEDRRTVSFSDNPQFQRGREFLDQAWIALENNNEEAAIHYFEMAEKHFSRALIINPDDVPTLMNRATAYLGLDKYALALQDFDSVLGVNSAYAPAYEGKALVYEEMGDFEKSQEMLEIVNDIYNELYPSEIVSDEPEPTPNGIYYSTWYASDTRHYFQNRFTGAITPLAQGFGCGITQPWKTNIENAAYFHLPGTTWSRNTEGMQFGGTGVPLGWQSLNGNTQGYTNAAPFFGWTVPNGENYVLLISETGVCTGTWLPGGSRYRISAYSNY